MPAVSAGAEVGGCSHASVHRHHYIFYMGLLQAVHGGGRVLAGGAVFCVGLAVLARHGISAVDADKTVRHGGMESFGIAAAFLADCGEEFFIYDAQGVRAVAASHFLPSIWSMYASSFSIEKSLYIATAATTPVALARSSP